jgi:adenylosuccinate lyase
MVALTNETPRIPALPRALATDAANRLEELERENARLREALEKIILLSNRPAVGEDDYSRAYMDGRLIPRDVAREALAGSEK